MYTAAFTYVPSFAGSLCDKCVVLKERVKDAPCVFGVWVVVVNITEKSVLIK